MDGRTNRPLISGTLATLQDDLREQTYDQARDAESCNSGDVE
jgi:hypothetical protein